MEPVLTLADLDSWSFRGIALAVLGHPIKHSISPALHNAALARMAVTEKRFSQWRYFRFDVPPADLPTALQRLHAAGFHGLNLTVPHKVLAFDRIAAVDAAAQPIGAVNTLLNTPRGWRGFNTDGYGLATGIRETLGLCVTGSPIILLGAGGAARGAALECLSRHCASLHLANRTAAHRDALLDHLQPLATGIELHGFDPANPPADLPAGAIVINATSAGLKPDDPPPIDLGRVPRPAGVFDMIYNPPETPLLTTARSAGVPAANGLAMLVHQGARALEIWSGSDVPVDVMSTAAAAALS